MTGEGRTSLLARPSAWWLVVANLLPVFGVWQLGWSVGELLLLYWVETTIIGAFGIIKLVGAGYDPLQPARQLLARVPRSFFFIIHFGGFSAAHVLFLNEIFGLPTPDRFLLFAVLGLAASHAVSFLSNYIGKREYRTDEPGQFMLAPYGRVVVLHVVVIFGAMLVEKTGSALPALLILIALKTTVDLAAHGREHRKAEAARSNEQQAVLSETLSLADAAPASRD